MRMRILGIDPGLERTGYGVIDVPAGAAPPRLIEAGVIRTRPGNPLPARLAEIHAGLGGVFADFRPDTMAVEELYSHYRHPRTAILMGHARGIALVAAAQAGVAVVSYSATNVKKSLLGSGHASKEQVQRMVQSLFALKDVPHPPDVADALAVALCHAYRASRLALQVRKAFAVRVPARRM